MASYQAEREACIAQLTREGLELRAIRTLLRHATTINRLAELACSSEAADRDRILCPAARKYGPCLCDEPNENHVMALRHVQPIPTIPRIRWQDYQAEQRALRCVPDGWAVVTSGDPRGYTLRVIPPSYAERNAGRPKHDLDAIGVPPGPSRVRF